MASSFIRTSIDLLSSGGLKVMPVSFVSSLLCTLKSFLIVQASPFSNPVSNFLNCLLSFRDRSEEHTSELQSRFDLVCRLLLEKKKNVGHERALGVRGVDRTRRC